MAKLVGATGDNGYLTILSRAFDEKSPSPSSFCQFRKTVSHQFFKDQYLREVKEWQEKNRPKFEGLFVNAIDGDKLILPYSQDILDEGYRGIPCKNNQETHYPAMYYCASTDVISGVPVGFSESCENDEIARAIELLGSSHSPEKTLTIFDRFYFCKRLLKFYEKPDRGFFLARCKTGATFKEIIDFASSSLQEKEVEIKGVKCRLLRFKRPNSEEETILVTNLPKRFKASKILGLYGYRWESETGNRDRTTSIKIEQFRAKNINGILQEVWMTLLLQAVGQIACAKEIKPEKYFMKKIYIKANFKAVFNKIVEGIGTIISGLKCAYQLTKDLVLRSKQKREHYKRQYKRETKQITGKTFKRKSLVTRRE
jgi:hypothetical protein